MAGLHSNFGWRADFLVLGLDYQTVYALVIDTREDDWAKGIHLYYYSVALVKKEAGNGQVTS